MKMFNLKPELFMYFCGLWRKRQGRLLNPDGKRKRITISYLFLKASKRIWLLVFLF